MNPPSPRSTTPLLDHVVYLIGKEGPSRRNFFVVYTLLAFSIPIVSSAFAIGTLVIQVMDMVIQGNAHWWGLAKPSLILIATVCGTAGSASTMLSHISDSSGGVPMTEIGFRSGVRGFCLNSFQTTIVWGVLGFDLSWASIYLPSYSTGLMHCGLFFYRYFVNKKAVEVVAPDIRPVPWCGYDES